MELQTTTHPIVTVEIPLTRGYVALVDAEDAIWLNDFKWCVLLQDRRYAVRSVKTDGTTQHIRMHRLILNAPAGKQVDHINGDTLDNRRSNLRLATASQNMCNKRMLDSNVSGYRGVSFFKPHKKYRATISLNRKQRTVGYFSSPEEAARAYDKAALEIHGEFARLNFPS